MMLNYAQSYGLTTQLYALALATGVLGSAIHIAFTAIERRALRWHPSQRLECGVSRRRTEALKLAPRSRFRSRSSLVWQAWARSADSQFFPPPRRSLQEFRDLWLFAQFARTSSRA